MQVFRITLFVLMLPFLLDDLCRQVVNVPKRAVGEIIQYVPLIGKVTESKIGTLASIVDLVLF